MKKSSGRQRWPRRENPPGARRGIPWRPRLPRESKPGLPSCSFLGVRVDQFLETFFFLPLLPLAQRLSGFPGDTAYSQAEDGEQSQCQHASGRKVEKGQGGDQGNRPRRASERIHCPDQVPATTQVMHGLLAIDAMGGFHNVRVSSAVRVGP